MGQVSDATVIELFKEAYGEHFDLVPDDNHLAKVMPFSEKGRVGDVFKESVVLTNETGITLSDITDAFTIAPARAGVTKQTSVAPYIMVLPSILPWGVISRSVNDKVSFFRASKFIVKNNLKSHYKILEIMRLYGQSDKLLGYVSYATATYRNASFTNGTGTLTLKDGSTIAFTNGVNVAEKAILMAPGDFSSMWLGLEGIKVNQVDSTGAILASGSLVGVNAPLGYLTVDFVPSAATSATSTRISLDGMQDNKSAIGLHKILNNTGTLFGINAAQYSLWNSAVVDVNNQKLNLQLIQDGIAQMVLQGGDDSDLDLYVNPRSWANLADEQTNLVRYDSKYKTSEFVNGAEGIRFYSQNGSLTVHSHRMVMEGDAFCINKSCWLRSGSAEASFKIPGMDNGEDLIKSLENQAGYQFRSYSDQYIFCHRPADNIYFKNINDEATS